MADLIHKQVMASGSKKEIFQLKKQFYSMVLSSGLEDVIEFDPGNTSEEILESISRINETVNKVLSYEKKKTLQNKA